MPLLASPEKIAAAFDTAQWPDRIASSKDYTTAVQLFVNTWFGTLESDLIYPFSSTLLPPPPPGWLPAVTVTSARDWADALHATWGTLCRAAAPVVHENPQLYTLLPVPGPFIIPGARFREGYYWDSYWAVRGLLISGLIDLAKNVVLNLVHCVTTHGFVPNGLRSYYLNRSQPPLLAAMVEAVWSATNDREFLKKSLPALDKELKWWRAATRSLMVSTSQGEHQPQYLVSRYYASWERPRPESYKEDLATAAEATAAGSDMTRSELFRHIASAAESGWDFSSRWFRDEKTLPTIRTTDIIPADLNALLYKAEKCVVALAQAAGQEELAQHWSGAAAQRLEAIHNLHWVPADGRWRDLLLEGSNNSSYIVGVAQCSPDPAVYASDFVPLWCGCAEVAGSDKALAAVDALRNSGLLGIGGIAASTVETGEQWDWPNAWPPLQSVLAEGCEQYGGEQGVELAKSIADKYLKTAHAAWMSTGRMFEKFDVREVGVHGGGGEYACMDGFGWTNGLALVWLDKYGWGEDNEEEK